MTRLGAGNRWAGPSRQWQRVPALGAAAAVGPGTVLLAVTVRSLSAARGGAFRPRPLPYGREFSNLIAFCSLTYGPSDEARMEAGKPDGLLRA